MQSGSTPKIRDYFSDLQSPTAEDLQYEIEQLVLQGVLTPEEAQTVMLERSAMNDINTDPQYKHDQLAAVAALKDISDSGGMTMMDEANLRKIQNDEAAQSRGAREAILSSAQARGLGGSGIQLMSQLQNQQASATRQSQRDMDIAALAQQRALDSLIEQGSLAGQMQQRDFNQQAQTAGANDAIAKFNAQNSQNQINLNTGARNDAQAKNLAASQAIADANTGARNQKAAQKSQIAQQLFDNEYKKRAGQAGIATQNANNAGTDSQNRANATNTMIGTGLTAAGYFAGGPAGGAAAGALTEEQKKKKANQ